MHTHTPLLVLLLEQLSMFKICLKLLSAIYAQQSFSLSFCHAHLWMFIYCSVAAPFLSFPLSIWSDLPSALT